MFFTALALAASAPAALQPQEVAALHDFAAYCARSAQLWGRSLCGPMVLVDPNDRRAVANARPAGAGFRQVNGVWVGTLPARIGLANTSIQWGGRHWAEVMLPLPGDPADLRVLLAHEAFHRIQPDLGFKGRETDNGHLDSRDGRIYARLEMAALEAALKAARERRDWRQPASDALAYRSARLAAFAQAQDAEAALLANEGLAEYTGIRVGAPRTRTAVAVQRLQGGSDRPSLIRSFGYVAGPAYGLLLDRTGAPWRMAALKGEPVPDLLRKRLSLPERLTADMTAYGASTIVAEETRRDAGIQQRRNSLIAALVDGPSVNFPFEKMQIDFNPNSLFSLGANGTAYTRATIRDAWGELKASGDVLVSPNWDFARVPGPAAANGQALSGPGWSATLAPGYALVPGAGPNRWVIAKRP